MLRDIPFHIVYSTGENEPVEFFFDALLESTSFDLGLGYFSSSAINVLSAGFAYFIHRGGKMRIIINDVLSTEDKEAIEKGIKNEVNTIEENILSDLNTLTKTFSKPTTHFFKCLSYLISKNRIEFIATIPANEKGGIAHNKFGVFTDEANNKVGFNGSVNFSRNALLNNIESISCYKSWSSSKSDTKRLEYFENVFLKAWTGEDRNIKIIPLSKVKTTIRDSFSVDNSFDLLDEMKELSEEILEYPESIKIKIAEIHNKLNKRNFLPKFPYSQGPRDYQNKAYENWTKNNCQGIFAMATGTGKTITSLNFVLEEFKKSGNYNVLILVPTRALVSQWISEAKKFNYQNIHSTQEKEWFNILSSHFLNIYLGLNDNLIFISTYQSYNGNKFRKLAKKKGWENFILIADEAHNLGASQSLRNLPNKINKRIGLSATPERIYDDYGSDKIYEYFNSYPPCYTYSYSMYKAIHTEPASLVQYYYYPYFASLSKEELIDYKTITEKLILNYDSKKREFNDYGKKLLIERKRIINKAENKIKTLQDIFIDVSDKEKNLNYTFVYVPEGQDTDFSNADIIKYNNDERKLIRKYGEAIRTFGYSTHELLSDTPNKERVLNQFANGKIDVLLAMKILDEGVDIPVTKNAIFCASTGNPRQYIQRRGRVLRKSEGKNYANIYDIIVAPQENFIDSLPSDLKDMEIRIFQNELRRVANFLYAAENRHQVINGKLGYLAIKYSIDLISLIEDNLNIDNICNQ
jgi:superfamily II DNA or RNA helicase